MNNKVLTFILIIALLVAIIAKPVQANRRELVQAATQYVTLANTDIIADYTPAPSVKHLEITVALTGNPAIFQIEWAGDIFNLNRSVALVAGESYTFTHGVNSNSTYNFQTSAGTTLNYIITEVHER